MQTESYPEIAIPKIGAGLAGGNWEIISRIIDDATGDDLDVYVYYLED
jgi:O-acetyl-ADP-ribose deacetylase (regulator of RNase III)